MLLCEVTISFRSVGGAKEYQMNEGALEEAVAAAVDVAFADAFSDAFQPPPHATLQRQFFVLQIHKMRLSTLDRRQPAHNKQICYVLLS